VLAATTASGCTPGGERAAPTSPPVTDVVRSLGTLPPIRTFTHPTGADDVVVQISTSPDGRRDQPLLTVYGDGLVIGLVGDEWRSGVTDEPRLQAFLDRAESVGLLDASLDLRNTVRELPRPDITVVLRVDGRDLEHRLDLARIERPAQPRAFLQEAALRNVFELTDPYDPPTWLTCSPAGCSIVDERRTVEDRPQLPHEDRSDLATAADAASG
jgi:hypothetical protein